MVMPMDDAIETIPDGGDRIPNVEAFSERLRAAIRDERGRHAELVLPVDEKLYREAVEGLIALGGSDPTAWAPPRRRFP